MTFCNSDSCYICLSGQVTIDNMASFTIYCRAWVLFFKYDLALPNDIISLCYDVNHRFMFGALVP